MDTWNKFKKRPVNVISLAIICALIAFSFILPLFLDTKIDNIDLFNISSSPGNGHLLGTDEIGRDVFTRLAYGGRVSLSVGLFATALQVVIGVTLGIIAGYFGGVIDALIMRLTDIVMCFPFFIIAISLSVIIGANMLNIILIIGLLSWTEIARIVRARVLSIKEMEFIEASKALGLTDFEIIKEHVVINVIPQIVVYSTLAIASAILVEASLSFLGMGITPPTPSWGNMLSAAQSMRVLTTQWWSWIPPGILVLLTVSSINIIGDGLKKVLDPEDTI